MKQSLRIFLLHLSLSPCTLYNLVPLSLLVPCLAPSLSLLATLQTTLVSSGSFQLKPSNWQYCFAFFCWLQPPNGLHICANSHCFQNQLVVEGTMWNCFRFCHAFCEAAVSRVGCCKEAGTLVVQAVAMRWESLPASWTANKMSYVNPSIHLLCCFSVLLQEWIGISLKVCRLLWGTWEIYLMTYGETKPTFAEIFYAGFMIFALLVVRQLSIANQAHIRNGLFWGETVPQECSQWVLFNCAIFSANPDLFTYEFGFSALSFF